MSQDDRSGASVLGLAGVAMAVCCGLPLLVGAGIALSAVGLALGSVVIVLGGAGMALWGWRRRRARRFELPVGDRPPTGGTERFGG